MAARASYLAGFAGTATVLAGQEFGIPIYGTMAHSFIESYDDESAAFAAFAQSRPDNLIAADRHLRYRAAARKVVALAPKLAQAGITIRGVRLDSGDLIALSRSVRAILDAGGLQDVTIFASGGLDEDELAVFAQAGCADRRAWHRHRLTTSSDAPALDVAYKLQEYAGVRGASARPKGHLARPQAGLAALRCGRPHGGRYPVARAPLQESARTENGEPLVRLVMKSGKRVAPAPSLDDIRRHSKRELDVCRRLCSGSTPAPSILLRWRKSFRDLATKWTAASLRSGQNEGRRHEERLSDPLTSRGDRVGRDVGRG